MKYFRCSRTGVLFPPDYIEEWGRRYGIGLGSMPVSEALVNCYESPIGNCKDPLHTMYPVAVCRSQVDLVDIPDKDPQLEKKAILAIDDLDMVLRSEVMRQRQRVHSAEMGRIYKSEVEFKEARLRLANAANSPKRN